MGTTTGGKGTAGPAWLGGARIRDEQECERAIAARFLDRAGKNVGGYVGVIREVLRNMVQYSHASRIVIAAGGRPIVWRLADNGIGMNEVARARNHMFGISERGSGHGGRGSCLDMARILRIYTITRDDPATVWATEFEKTSFFEDLIARNVRSGKWYAADRSTLLPGIIPDGFKSGTVFELSEFFEPGSVPGADWIIQQVSDPGIMNPYKASSVTVNGKRVKPRAIDGYLLADEHFEVAPFGAVHAALWLPSRDATVGLWLGAVDAVCTFTDFIRQLRQINPDVAKRMPREFLDTRLIGHLFVDALQDFQTQGQHRLDWKLFRAPLVARIVDELLALRLAPKIAERLVEYDRTENAERGNEVIGAVVSEMNAAMGVTSNDFIGGTGGDDEPAEDVLPPLRITPAHPAPVSAGDRLTLAIRTPVPGEAYLWDDFGQGFLTEKTGISVTVTAGDIPGRYPIAVAAVGNPNRYHAVQVRVLARDPEEVEVKPFKLLPHIAYFIQGDEHNRVKVVRVAAQGTTSGQYAWKLEKGRGIVAILPRSDVHVELEFLRGEPGEYDYLLCADAKDPNLVARCRVEILASERADDPEEDKDDGRGGGSGISGAGTYRGFDEQLLSFKGRQYRVVSAKFLDRPFIMDPENGVIQISVEYPRFTELRDAPDGSRTYVRAIIAAAIAEDRRMLGFLGREEDQAVGEIYRFVLSLGLSVGSDDSGKVA